MTLGRRDVELTQATCRRRPRRSLPFLRWFSQRHPSTGHDVSAVLCPVHPRRLTAGAEPAVPGGVSVSYELSPRSVTTFVAPVTVDGAAAANPACSRVLPQEESDSTGCSCRHVGGTRAPAAWVVMFVVLVGVVGGRARRAEHERGYSIRHPVKDPVLRE